MCEVHLIQPEPFAAREDDAAAHGAPVEARRETPQRGHLVFLRAMPYGRVMHEVHLAAALLAAGWGAAYVAVMLVRDLVASR
jgi:hypothetical protein